MSKSTPNEDWFFLIVGVLLVLLSGLLIYCHDADCSQRHCPQGQKPILVKQLFTYECVCGMEARP